MHQDPPPLVHRLGLMGAGALWPAYVGVVAELLERGALRELRRFVGISSGSIVAALTSARLARFSALQVADMLRKDAVSIDMRIVLFDDHDHRDGRSRVVLERGCGLHGAGNIMALVRNEMQRALGDGDATLLELRDASGIDFGVVVWEFPAREFRTLDASTHPNLPVWVAVRASCSIFPLVAPVRLPGNEQWWVDPALLPDYRVYLREHALVGDGALAVVSTFGEPPSAWGWRSPSFNHSWLELMCIRLMTVMAQSNPPNNRCTVLDAVHVPVSGSFALNLGIATVDPTHLVRAGVRQAKAFLAIRRALAPVRPPDGVDADVALACK